ncbi:intron-binding protein aquarius-like [Sinocyclocheilus rhinocerous]|uniref:intron-binding protein aquarius-like n=1 Tax=Sinocyclocheilus rhinocerous TaxID=307959 RepID=UPI0007BA3303|nr:PREDICTED: intron-binding protein aquarius-like [Sinocyclocheilus rhinocerous]
MLTRRAYFIPVLCFSLKLSNKYWAPHVKNKLPFDSQVIEDIYQNEILKSKFAIRKIMLLEFSQYLENYLWPNYTPEASTNGYLMSICCIVNEKFRENVPAWEVFKKAPTHFPHFFKCVMESCLSGEQLGLPHISCPTVYELYILLSITSATFIKMHVVQYKTSILYSIKINFVFIQTRLQQELKKVPKLQKFWNLIKKNYEKMEPQDTEQAKKERTFLASLIKKFLVVLMSIPAAGTISMEKVHYCERFIEFMIDLEALRPTRFLIEIVSCFLSRVVSQR